MPDQKDRSPEELAYDAECNDKLKEFRQLLDEITFAEAFAEKLQPKGKSPSLTVSFEEAKKFCDIFIEHAAMYYSSKYNIRIGNKESNNAFPLLFGENEETLRRKGTDITVSPERTQFIAAAAITIKQGIAETLSRDINISDLQFDKVFC